MRKLQVQFSEWRWSSPVPLLWRKFNCPSTISLSSPFFKKKGLILWSIWENVEAKESLELSLKSWSWIWAEVSSASLEVCVPLKRACSSAVQSNCGQPCPATPPYLSWCFYGPAPSHLRSRRLEDLQSNESRKDCWSCQCNAANWERTCNVCTSWDETAKHAAFIFYTTLHYKMHSLVFQTIILYTRLQHESSRLSNSHSLHYTTLQHAFSPLSNHTQIRMFATRCFVLIRWAGGVWWFIHMLQSHAMWLMAKYRELMG